MIVRGNDSAAALVAAGVALVVVIAIVVANKRSGRTNQNVKGPSM